MMTGKPFDESKSTKIADILKNYMVARNYKNEPMSNSSPRVLETQMKTLSLCNLLESKSCRTKAVLCCCGTPDVASIDEQFSSFKDHIEHSSGELKAQLENLLFPVFLHIFLELTQNGQKGFAAKFLKQHSVKFIGDSSKRQLLEAAAAIHSSLDIDISPDLCAFRKNKVVVKLTDLCLKNLSTFLSEHKCCVVIDTLNSYFDIGIINGCETIVEVENDTKCLRKMSMDSKNISKPSKCETLSKAIENMKGKAVFHPSIYFQILKLNKNLLQSVDINQTNSLVALGLDNSLIEIIPSLRDTSMKKEKVQLCGHMGPVYDVKFVSSSNLLSCSEDTGILLWNLASCCPISLYSGHNYPVHTLDVDLHSNMFVSGSMDTTVKIWYFEKVHPLLTLVGHHLPVNVVKLHPNGNYVASGSSDKSVRLWSVQEGHLARVFQGHSGGVRCLTFSNDGKLLASAGEDNVIRVWDLAQGKIWLELPGHTDTVTSLTFDTNTHNLLSTSLEGIVCCWSLHRGPAIQPQIFPCREMKPLILKQCIDDLKLFFGLALLQ